MKTFSTLRNLISDRLSSSAKPSIASRPDRSVRNRNASPSRSADERDQCEEELYRLRYEIENLLESTGASDLQGLKKKLFNSSQRPFDPYYENNLSWIERCSPCCRRWRRPATTMSRRLFGGPKSQSYPSDTPNTYDSPETRRDGTTSNSPSPSRSSSTRPWSRNGPKKNLRESVSDLVNSGGSGTSRMFPSKNGSNGDYDPLMAKILELKAMDCLCADYSKQKNRQKLQQALAEAHMRSGEGPSGSSSRISNQSSPNTSGSSTGSSMASPNTSVSSDSLTPIQSVTPSPGSTGISTPKTSSMRLKSAGNSPRKQSRVKIVGGKKPRSRRSKGRKTTSSKGKMKTINAKTKSKQPLTPKPSHSASKVPRKKSKTSRRTKGKPLPGKKGKTPRRSRRTPSKRGKIPKSNNQVNDDDIEILSNIVCPPFCGKIYENPEQILKLLLASA